MNFAVIKGLGDWGTSFNLRRCSALQGRLLSAASPEGAKVLDFELKGSKREKDVTQITMNSDRDHCNY